LFAALFAQSVYPDKAIRILVGFPQAAPLTSRRGCLQTSLLRPGANPSLVENATGAGGNVAVDRAAKAVPDGYTLVMASSALPQSEPVRKSCRSIRSRTWHQISVVVLTPSVLVVHSDVSAKNVQELVALARAQPGKLTYGHAGVGTTVAPFRRAVQVGCWSEHSAGALPWQFRHCCPTCLQAASP